MAREFDKYSISSIDSVVGFDIASKECLFILDEIKDASLSGEAELIWATGKEGRRLSSFKRNKTCTFTCNNGFIVGGLLAQQTGDFTPEEDFDAATILMPAFERLTVTGGGTTVTTEFEAVGVAGNELGKIYKANQDGSQGQWYLQAATVSATEFSYDPATLAVTLPTGVFADGDIVIVFYERLTKGRRYSNKSDSYAGDVQLVMDIMIKDVCTGAQRHSKLVMPKATIGDNFSYSFGDDMAVQNLQVEANSSICSTDREYFYWVFPED